MLCSKLFASRRNATTQRTAHNCYTTQLDIQSMRAAAAACVRNNILHIVYICAKYTHAPHMQAHARWGSSREVRPQSAMCGCSFYVFCGGGYCGAVRCKCVSSRRARARLQPTDRRRRRRRRRRGFFSISQMQTCASAMLLCIAFMLCTLYNAYAMYYIYTHHVVFAHALLPMFISFSTLQHCTTRRSAAARLHPARCFALPADAALAPHTAHTLQARI